MPNFIRPVALKQCCYMWTDRQTGRQAGRQAGRHAVDWHYTIL